MTPLYSSFELHPRAQIISKIILDEYTYQIEKGICDKYATLAKDARSAGDTVLAESYLQHAEHYQRMIVMWNEQDAARQNEQQSQENTYNGQSEKEADNDDLSLPDSILGNKVQAESQKGRTSERILEDA